MVKLVLGSTEKEWWTKFLVGCNVNTDLLSEALAQALRSGWLHRDQLPADILEIAGDDRGLRQYPGETNEQYQARCNRAWSDWQFAGHETAIEGQLAAAGFPGAQVVYYPDREGPRGEAAPYWSQFWVRIPLSVLWGRPNWITAPKWGAVVWGCFWWGAGALSVEDANLFWSIVKTWKPNDYVCRGIELGL